jgi:hypothetical protein
MINKALKQNIIIGTTRFTNITWEQNKQWKIKRNHEGSLYGFSIEMPTSINYKDYIFIIDMNNDKNCIEGIGLIQNVSDDNNRTRIYDDKNYNRYVFKSKYYVEKEKIKDQKTLLFLEQILFTTQKHMKRGLGVTVLRYDRILTFNSDINKPKLDKKYVKSIHRLYCPHCLQKKKKNGLSHICPKLKKNYNDLNMILNFFKNLLKSFKFK